MVRRFEMVRRFGLLGARRLGKRSLFVLAIGVLLGGYVSIGTSTARAAPGGWTQAQVNTAIDNGVAYLATQQNADGSFGVGVAETGMALASYGVEAAGNFSNLPPAYQADVTNAINYLEANQDTAHSGPPDYFGSWTTFGSYQTYSTGLALLGLSFFPTVNPGVATAIANGRAFLTGPDFQGPANTGCSSADGLPGSDYCGGWNYDAGYGRSDESNTGYAMTGLEVTGGIPAGIVLDNINWQRHVQELATNPFASRNDGGADYQPGFCGGSPFGFCSNANNSGSNLFGYADDGVPAAAPPVAASITFDQDVLNAYELMMSNVGPGGLRMIAHSGATEDGSCTPDTGGCDWYTAGDGGFHYSLFALTKGLGSYIPSSLSDPTNWYAKVVDLLLSQQAGDGSWPPDLRDDFSTIFSTGLAVASLGKVAVIPSDTTPPTCSLIATIPGPPKQIQVEVQDTGSGLASILVTDSTNATTVVPPFVPGTTDPVVVTSTKIVQSQPSRLALRVTDVAGNVTNCDPVVPGSLLRAHARHQRLVRLRHQHRARVRW